MYGFTRSILCAALATLALAGPAAATPYKPDINFCNAFGNVTTRSFYADEPTAGVATSTSIFIPRTGGWFGIYFSNDGPGPVTFATPAFYRVDGTPIASGGTVIQSTPSGSVLLNDGGWAGIYEEDLDFIGCVHVGPGKGNFHLDLRFTRGTTTYTERINVHYR